MKLSGPMFERDGQIWKSVHKKEGAHYNTYGCEEVNGMAGLRAMFDDGVANEMNFCLFSTSGVHGMYTTLEEVEDWVINGKADPDYDEGEGPEDLTFLIVQPRIVCLRYGNCLPKTPEDFTFLKRLRQTSWEAVQKIGHPPTPSERGEEQP